MSNSFSLSQDAKASSASVSLPKELGMISEIIEADVISMKIISDYMAILQRHLPEGEQRIVQSAMALHMRAMLKILNICDGKV